MRRRQMGDLALARSPICDIDVKSRSLLFCALVMLNRVRRLFVRVLARALAVAVLFLLRTQPCAARPCAARPCAALPYVSSRPRGARLDLLRSCVDAFLFPARQPFWISSMNNFCIGVCLAARPLPMQADSLFSALALSQSRRRSGLAGKHGKARPRGRAECHAIDLRPT